MGSTLVFVKPTEEGNEHMVESNPVQVQVQSMYLIKRRVTSFYWACVV